MDLPPQIDIRRYLTDPAYKAAIDAASEEDLKKADEFHRWLWDISDAPGLAAQHFSVAAGTGRPSGFTPAVLGTWILEKRPMVLGSNGLLYGCGMVGSGAGLYQECEDWARKICLMSHGLSYTGDPPGQLVKWLRNELGSSKVDLTTPLPGGLVNVKNGMLDLISGDVSLHSCDYASIVQIPVNWNPVAVCPKLDRFLGEVCPDEETIELVWQMFGYILFGRNERQKAFLLRGPGGNGKSVLLWVLTNLLGRQYVQVSSLADLCDNRFRAAGLYGKRANVCGDIGTKAVENVDMFKKLTSGIDGVEVEHKGKDPFEFVNKAVLVFSANDDPRLNDKTRAVSDRWIIISMPNVFRGKPGVENTNLSAELTSATELEGALLKARDAYLRLEDQNRFNEPKDSLRLKREYKSSNSSAMDFFYHCLEECDCNWTVPKFGTPACPHFVPRSHLHNVYKLWMEEEGDLKYLIKKRKFLSEFEQELGPVGDESYRIHTNHGGERLIKGLRWSDQAKDYLMRYYGKELTERFYEAYREPYNSE